ncbi:MAG: hypothetical protein OXC07_07805, partial [Kistimonas sp.]|nr:hypothetical protein [Kistimonas sp.]
MFRDILVRVFFLVFVAVLGWIAGRLLKIKTKGLSDLVIYVISPFFACHAIVDSSVGHSFFKYTFVAFAFSSVLGLCAYAIGRWLWKDCRANLFGFAGGDSNTGYFALPVALSLFDSQQIAVAIFMASGVVLYEFSVGYLIVAKGVMPARQSLRRFVR